MRVGYVGKRKEEVAKAAGFTITELLVVMAIIGVLAAIIFPVIIKSKEGAKVTACLSNMRQLGAGLGVYLGDYSYRFPSAVGWGSPSYWAERDHGSEKTIQELLLPYANNGMHLEKDGRYSAPGVFGCPSDTGHRVQESVYGVPPNKPIWQYAGCSYEYYAADQVDWFLPGSDEPKQWTGLSPELKTRSVAKHIGAPLNSILSTTHKAVLGDTWYWHMGDQVPDGRLAYRNTLFADGHAARVSGTDHEDARLQPLTPWYGAAGVAEK